MKPPLCKPPTTRGTESARTAAAPGTEIQLGLGHHYRLEQRLAQASCGDLWRALWLGTSEAVVVKMARGGRDATTEAASFNAPHWADDILRTEISGLRRFNHPHIVAWRAGGQWHGRPTVVMELLQESLLHRLAQPVSAEQAERWIRQTAAALAALHRAGLRHLDLKPANLLLTAPGALGQRIKLADFGACMPAQRLEHGLRGTPGWAAPEQLRATGVTGGAFDGQARFVTTEAADYHALGQLWFRMLTGRLTRFGQTALAAYCQHGVEGLLHTAATGGLGDGGLCPDDLRTLTPGGAVPRPPDVLPVDDAPTWQVPGHSGPASPAVGVPRVGGQSTWAPACRARGGTARERIVGLCSADLEERRHAFHGLMRRPE